MKLTAAQKRMLELLTNEPQRPGHLGTMMWPEKSRTPSAYARPAGRVLNALKALGLAQWVATSADVWGWIRTHKANLCLPVKRP